MILNKTLTGLLIALFIAGFSFGQNQNTLDKVITELGQRITQVTPVVEKAQKPEATAALATGVDHYNKAKDLNASGNTKEATKECNISAKFIAKAYAIATDQSTIEVLLKQLSAYIEKVKVIVDKSGNADAAAVLAKATEHNDLAVTLAKNDKKKEAMVEVKTATKLAAKAEMIAKAQIVLDAKIVKLGTKIDVVKALVDKTTNAEAKKVFDLGVEQYQKAIASNKDGKLREAANELKVAAALITKAETLAKQ